MPLRAGHLPVSAGHRRSARLSAPERIPDQWWLDPGAAGVPTAVLAWLDAALHAAGHARTGPVDVTHRRPWSAMVRVPTDGGGHWLKVNSAATAHEITVLQVLAREAPEAVLVPLRADRDRGLVLLPDGGPLLGDVVRPRPPAGPADAPPGLAAGPAEGGTALDLHRHDPEDPPWALGMARALNAHARIQMAITPHVPELLAAGVPDMRPERLLDRFDEALDAAAQHALVADGAWVRTQVADVVDVRSRVADEAAELGALAVDASIDHDDLHPWNLLRPTAPGRPPKAIDWGDAVVAHPFTVLLVPLRARRVRDDNEPGLVALRRAYLGPWADAAPRSELLRAADLACRLGSIVRAHAWLRVLEATRAAQVERAALTSRTSALVETGTSQRRPTSAELVPLLWLRNLALPSPLGVPTLQG